MTWLEAGKYYNCVVSNDIFYQWGEYQYGLYKKGEFEGDIVYTKIVKSIGRGLIRWGDQPGTGMTTGWKGTKESWVYLGKAYEQGNEISKIVRRKFSRSG